MGEIVLGLATVHAPFITGRPDVAPDQRREAVMAGFEELREVLAQFQPDVLVAFSNEHITNFLSDNVPAFCVGVGKSNRALPEFRLPEANVPGHPEFANAFVRYAYDHDFDLSYSSQLLLDHGTGLPLALLTPNYDIPVVVILQNVIWSPMPRVSRSFELGQLLAQFVKHELGETRVAVLGTGGISHFVGNQRHGDVDADFDEAFLAEIAKGHYEQIAHIAQERIDAAGDGANEIRNWIAVCGAIGSKPPRVVLDETFIPGWNTSAYQVVWS